MCAQLRKRIVCIHNGHPRLRLKNPDVASLIHTLDRYFRIPNIDRPFLSRPLSENGDPNRSPVAPGELSIAFLTDEALAQIHSTFLGDPAKTDVITFEGNIPIDQAGEICVSVDMAKSYAARQRISFSEELTLYCIHGWLHLAGYDDLEREKKKRMRAAEARAIKLIKEKSKLPRFVFEEEGTIGKN